MIVIIKNFFINIFVLLLNLFIWRSKKIWVIGGWMGQKYADNSRFLYDYLYQNKKKYSLKKIVWVTRNKDVQETLLKNGFEDVCLIGTRKSFFYHIKAGVHVICNSNGLGIPGDIDTRFSIGAKKLQLWHGVGIKACSRLTRKDGHAVKYWINDHIVGHFKKPGHWNKCFFLATSQENARVAEEDFGIKKKRIILAQYPRDYWNPTFFDEEKETINNVINKRITHRIVLFLPTFRNNNDSYLAPELIPGFKTFIEDNDIFWIQKSHSADKNLSLATNSDNVMSLKPSFDVNLLYDYIDLLISDYSSASTDAMSKDKIIIDYCPDYDYYKNMDRGFVNDFDLYHTGNFVNKPETLFSEIINCLDNNGNLDKKRYEKTKKFLLGEKEWNMDKLISEIMKAMKV